MASEDKNDQLLFTNMRQMISLIDRLRDFNLDTYISLPRITVLGDQSSGKSSLLEAICGMNFLPRGNGVVTRRPFELRMIRQANLKTPYFLFPNDFKDKKIEGYNNIINTIESLTNKTAGNEKGISSEPIIGQVFSSNVPDLTLVDLPGITRIPIGNQPKNIEEITKNIVRKYCQDPGSLILCVIPANIDLSTSDALKMAKELDPQGIRTLGVLTKVDLMDEGTDAMKILLNQEIKLLHGFVGVKNRSQKEINENVSVEESIKKELDFFGRHPVYQSMPTELLGTRSLIDKITKILSEMIKIAMPRIKAEITERKKRSKEILSNLGEGFPDTDEGKLEQVFKLVRKFKQYYDQELNGQYFYIKKKRNESIRERKETITFKLSQIFQTLYDQYTDSKFRITDGYSDEYVLNAINTYQGESMPGFHSFDSFLFLISPKLELLKNPIYLLLNDAKLILEERGVELIEHIFKKLPGLLSEVKDAFMKSLTQSKSNTLRILENLIRCEENYIYTNDVQILQKPFVNYQKQTISINDMLIQELKCRIDIYFNIVVKNLRNQIPKIIGHFLVSKFSQVLEVDILNYLGQKNYCINLLTENTIQEQQRKQTKKEMEALTKAENLLYNEFGLVFNLKSDIQHDQLVEQKQLSTEYNVHSSLVEDNDIEDIGNMYDEYIQFNQHLLYFQGGQFEAQKQQTSLFPQSNLERQSFQKQLYLQEQQKDLSLVNQQKDNYNNYQTGQQSNIVINYGNTPRQETTEVNQYQKPNQQQNRSTKELNQNYQKPTSNAQIPVNNIQQTQQPGNQFYQQYNSNQNYQRNILNNQNTNLTPDQIMQGIQTANEVNKTLDKNLTQQEKNNLVSVAKDSAKFVSENVTKEQLIYGIDKTVYYGKKVAESKEAQYVKDGIVNLVSGQMGTNQQQGPQESKQQAQPPKKKDNSLFSNLFG